MAHDVTVIVIVGVLTIAGVWLVTEMIWTVRELRRRTTEEDEE